MIKSKQKSKDCPLSVSCKFWGRWLKSCATICCKIEGLLLWHHSFSLLVTECLAKNVITRLRSCELFFSFFCSLDVWWCLVRNESGLELRFFKFLPSICCCWLSNTHTLLGISANQIVDKSDIRNEFRLVAGKLILTLYFLR